MRTIKLIGIGIVLVMFLIGGWFIFGSYSNGYRAGRIIKVTTKGFIFKTHEGQLDIGGLDNSSVDGAATTLWNFSIRSEQVLKDLEAAVDNQYAVKLHYKEKFYKLFFMGDTKYFVDSVIVVKQLNGIKSGDLPATGY